MISVTYINRGDINYAQAKHQAIILSNLAHRLKIAQADQNLELLSLLEQERQQLEQSYQRSFQTDKRNLWDWLTQPARLSITQVSSNTELGNSGRYFRGYNPITGEIRYGATEADMIDWVEE